MAVSTLQVCNKSRKSCTKRSCRTCHNCVDIVEYISILWCLSLSVDGTVDRIYNVGAENQVVLVEYGSIAPAPIHNACTLIFSQS